MELRRTTMGPLALVLAFAAGLGAIPCDAGAQGPGGPGGGFGGPIMGGPGGPGGPGGMANPLISNPMALLQRAEVQNDLHLDLRQKKAIEELQSQSQAGMRGRMQQAMQGIDFQQMRTLSPEARQAKMAEIQPLMQAAMQSWQGELNDKIKAILKPEQVTRIYQLDKQRRGPLALADPKIADELKLTQEHRAEIQKIQQEFQQQQGELMRSAFESMQGSGGFQPGQPPRFPDFTNKLSPWKQKMDKIRKAAEEKTLAVLNEQEKAAWKTANGEPFTFRADLPPQQRQNRRAGGF